MPEAPYGQSNGWLTCLTIDPAAFGADRETVRLHLESLNIESRPVWKPMHLQPVFRGHDAIGGGVAEELFRTGLCLPSGSSLSAAQQQTVISQIEQTHASAGAARVAVGA